MTFRFAIKKIAPHAVLAGVFGLFGMSLGHAALPLQQFALPSGAQVWLAESPGIPMVDVQIDFDAGSRRYWSAPTQDVTAIPPIEENFR